MMRAIAGLLVLLATDCLAAVDITTCGTVIPKNETGTLQADLACGTSPAITMMEGARLEMNGHHISQASHGVIADVEGGRLAISGPGEISGTDIGVLVQGPALVTLSDLDIHDNTMGVGADRVRLERVRIENSQGPGLTCNRNIVGTDVVVSNNGSFGIFTVLGRVRIRGLTANGNARYGILAPRVRLIDATVESNDLAYGGDAPDVDIASLRPPLLTDVTCGRSARLPYLAHLFDQPSWAVCASD
jgi:hypothetical protein